MNNLEKETLALKHSVQLEKLERKVSRIESQVEKLFVEVEKLKEANKPILSVLNILSDEELRRRITEI